MTFLLFLLGTLPASAGKEGSLDLSGTVIPAFDFALVPFNDGFAVRNASNALVLFQIGDREKSGRQVAWRRQAETLLLRTEYIPKTGGKADWGPVEIRILAP